MYAIKNKTNRKKSYKSEAFCRYTSNWGMIIRNMYIVFSEKSGYFCKIKIVLPIQNIAHGTK